MSYADVFRQFAAQSEAEFTDGGFFGSARVKARYRQWIITLDTFAMGKYDRFTRIRAPFVNPKEFRFALWRREAAHALDWVNFQDLPDVHLGEEDLDRDFFVKARSANMAQALFANEGIRALLQQQPFLLLDINNAHAVSRPAFPKGVDQLYFETDIVITDPQRLKALFDLFRAVLDQLCTIGAALEDNPNFDV